MMKLIKSVTLVTGEKFVLPPGAVLKGASDTNAFTSTCTIPTLETLTCYVAVIAGNKIEDDAGFYESTGAKLRGYRLNGVDYSFGTEYLASDFGVFDISSMNTELKTTLPAIINTATGNYGDSTRGFLNYSLIQTIPSLATNLELLFIGSAPLDTGIDDSNNDAVSRVPYRLLSTLSSAGYENLPTCPVIAPED